MFGGNGSGGSGNTQAWADMIAAIVAEDRNRGGWIYRGARPIVFPGYEYGFDAAIDIKNTLTLKGFGCGMAGGVATKLIFPQDSAGFRVQRYNTSGLNGPGVETTGGDGTIFEGLFIQGSATAPNIQNPGIHMRARAIVRDCVIAGFAGPGVGVIADTALVNWAYGNANNWEVSNCRIGGNGYSGIYSTGGDSNAGRTYGNDCSGNYRYGIEDRSFLGNSHRDNHADGNGIFGGIGFDQTSVVSDGDFRYRLIDGQDASGSTPPTAGATNAVWELMGAGAEALWAGIPLHSTYTGDFVSGGSYFIIGGNARSVFSGNYEEGGQATAVIASPSVSIGGFIAPGGGPHIYAEDNCPAAYYGWRHKKAIPNGPTITQTFGGRQTTGLATGADIFSSVHSTYSPAGWNFGYGGAGWFQPDDLYFSYNQGTQTAFKITGPGTAEQFGTGSASPYTVYFPKLAIRNSGGDETSAKIVYRAAGVSDPSGGVTVDAECRAQLAALIDALQAANLMS
jgi:hypothetical protein